MSEITLSAGVRQNLLSLQGTADMMSQTQNRLATGKKVNSALDNPTNFFTSQSLQARSNDLSSLLDSMSNGIKTIEAADNGLTSITKTLETMQATLRQARQDASFQTQSFAIGDIDTSSVQTLELSGGALGTTAVIDLNTEDVAATPATLEGDDGSDMTDNGGDPDLSALEDESITITADNGESFTYTFTDEASGQLANLIAAADAEGFTVTGTEDGLDISRADGSNFTITTSDGAVDTVIGHTSGAQSNDGVEASDGAAKTVDALVQEINSDTNLNSAIRASNDDGELRIENLSTQDLTVGGLNNEGQITGGGEEAEISGNQVRGNLAGQFNELRDQLDKLADDASFNGINLLQGDRLTLTFNETGTSTIDIQTQDENAINSANLSLFNIEASELDANSSIDDLLGTVGQALNSVRSQASAFGSNLSIVENRTDFTKSMMNTLQTGADNLTLADTNEEGANMLALQTRQQLSSVALSMASQADQAVLRLF